MCKMPAQISCSRRTAAAAENAGFAASVAIFTPSRHGRTRTTGEVPWPGNSLVKVLQIAGAALGIPAAAAGTFAAYQNYFSTDVTCQKLRSNIVATMERNVAPETKRSLLRKDVNEFDKLCGDGDPDARTIFHAAVAAEHPAAEAAETGHATASAAVVQPDASSRRSQLRRSACLVPPAPKSTTAGLR